MKGGKTPLGYTILEVLIVLAVSGMMFVIAASFINGKQAKTSFSSGVNETASQIQDVIEQVTDGQYSDVPIDCNASGGNAHPTLGGTAQGANSDCVFLGKFLHFSVQGNADTYETISAAGVRLTNSGAPVTDIANSGASYIPGLTVTKSMPQHLQVTSVKINAGAVNDYMIGFLQSYGSSNGAGGISNGSRQPPKLYYVDTVNSNAPTPSAENKIKPAFLLPANDVAICLTDGGRYATVNLGSNSGQLTVGVKMLGTVAC